MTIHSKNTKSLKGKGHKENYHTADIYKNKYTSTYGRKKRSGNEVVREPVDKGREGIGTGGEIPIACVAGGILRASAFSPCEQSLF